MKKKKKKLALVKYKINQQYGLRIYSGRNESGEEPSSWSRALQARIGRGEDGSEEPTGEAFVDRLQKFNGTYGVEVTERSLLQSAMTFGFFLLLLISLFNLLFYKFV